MRGDPLQALITIIVLAAIIPVLFSIASMIQTQLYGNCYNEGYKAAEQKYLPTIKSLETELNKLRAERDFWRSQFEELNKEYYRLVTEKVTKYDVNLIRTDITQLSIEVNALYKQVNMIQNNLIQQNNYFSQLVNQYNFSFSVALLSTAAFSIEFITYTAFGRPIISNSIREVLVLFLAWIRSKMKRKKNRGGKNANRSEHGGKEDR